MLVELAHAAGQAAGVFGAKITGGGSGGSVAVITSEGGRAAVDAIAAQYAALSGHQPYIFAGSSMGAEDFGVLRLRSSTTKL